MFLQRNLLILFFLAFIFEILAANGGRHHLTAALIGDFACCSLSIPVTAPKTAPPPVTTVPSLFPPPFSPCRYQV